ncbi:flavin-containing monooxygenase FMO GS-OX-like 3 [Magnolia sinica]|uniref:flavin-containing monooxygenase FMO GS-OX-like 3 n=1 Tax=Magnolia sinica TaxID=86752 RepID=UPI002658D514|nr:flavin-containing monooxygenase FMO GS-OX-like 3 [Magnolia sinica]
MRSRAGRIDVESALLYGKLEDQIYMNPFLVLTKLRIGSRFIFITTRGENPILMARSCKVAVIGAGVSGLVAARELVREGHRVVVFEKSDRIGGTWVYDPRVESDPLGLDPSREIVHGSLYLSLRTNLPRQLMSFLDFPFTATGNGDSRTFPRHEEVLAYIEDFTAEFGLLELIRFGAEVVRVSSVDMRNINEWVVEWRTQGSDSIPESEIFDAVVICSGHHTEPRVAKIPGIDKWPGKQIHSHNYRIPDPFLDQIVVLIGKGPSGLDICRDISKLAKEVHLTSRSIDVEVAKLEGHDNIWQHPMIKSIHEDGTVLFHDGSSVFADVIFHCTGYNYNFPFLETNGIVSVDDNRVGPLYKHVFPPRLAPWISFVGIPSKVITFITFELQSKWVAHVLSGKVVLPKEEEMFASVEEFYMTMKEAGRPKHYTHTLYPSEFEYKNWLIAQLGLPPLDESIKQMYVSTITGLLSHFDGFRDQWDDGHWTQQSHSA